MHEGLILCLVPGSARVGAWEPDLDPRVLLSSHLLTLRPSEQQLNPTPLSAFLLNFISALSAATGYLSKGPMTGPLSSADRANLITGPERDGGREGTEKGGGEGAVTPYSGLSPRLSIPRMKY